MRKYLLIIILIIVAILFFSIVFWGLKIGNFKINSYNEILAISNEKKELLASLDNKNTKEFEEKEKALNEAVKEYKTKKSEYDKLAEEGKITDSSIQNSIYLYDMDFLLTTIGSYATQKGVTLQFDVSKSTTSTSISSEYIMCDLNFTITGEYIPITDFIYSIEDDDKLGFEIRDFLIEKGGENLQATFVVKDVPINSKNLSSVPTTSSSYDENLNNSNN
jgi:hypothetical protein